MKFPQSVADAVGFALQVIAGATSFIIVFLAAVAIGAVVHHFEKLGLVPGWLKVGAQAMEMSLFAVDFIVFGLFLLTEVLKAIRRIVEEWKKPHG